MLISHYLPAVDTPGETQTPKSPAWHLLDDLLWTTERTIEGPSLLSHLTAG